MGSIRPKTRSLISPHRVPLTELSTPSRAPSRASSARSAG
ncbi:Uncharacterised protein [Mycobacteroides abscessus subsp. abscessus]|nr:Uncharacterised protein [Mycobacteroides abscessus subsp. abscessus]